MEAKNLFLTITSIFLLLALVGFASADLSLTKVNVPDANHGEGVKITLNLSSTENYTSLTWNGNADKGSWKNLDSLLDSINAGETEQVDVILSVDKYVSGIIYPTLNVTNGTDSDSLNFNLQVNEDKSLSVSDSTIPQEKNSTTIVVENNGNYDFSNVELTQSGDFDVEFNNSNFVLNAGDSKKIEVTMTSDREDLELGTNKVKVTATSDSTTASGSVKTENPYCDCENPGDLTSNIDDISVDGFGDDETWYPLDENEMDIEVENDGDYDVEDVEVEWGLYSISEQDFIIDDTESDFDLDEGEEETLTINFKLDDPDDFEDNGDYVIYVKATGTIDDSDSSNDGEDTCDETSEDIDMVIQDDLVLLDNIEVPRDISCGMIAQISADVWNVGEDDQDDVLILVENNQLGLSKQITFDEIEAFEDDEFYFEFDIPEDAEEKTYGIDFTVLDEDQDIYETDDDDEVEYILPMKVEGGCSVGGNVSDVTVSASLDSGGNAGEELVVKASITNTASESGVFLIDASDYEDWASLRSISQRSMSLEQGDSKDVLLTFNVDEDVAGEKTFKTNVLNDQGDKTTQPVSVNITGKPANVFSDLITKGNTYLWILGAINIILVILIIIVVIRLLKK